VYYWNGDDAEWLIEEDACQSVMPYFTTKEHAKRACDMLNSGEVEL